MVSVLYVAALLSVCHVAELLSAGRKYFQLQKNWYGRGKASAKYYADPPYDVHRIKVDEQHSLVMTTHEYGGLTVFDLETTEVLWKLPRVRVCCIHM